MATFEENLEKISNAIYGKEVRQAIHDALDEVGGAMLAAHSAISASFKAISGSDSTLYFVLDKADSEYKQLTTKAGGIVSKNNATLGEKLYLCFVCGNGGDSFRIGEYMYFSSGNTAIGLAAIKSYDVLEFECVKVPSGAYDTLYSWEPTSIVIQ